MRQVRSPWPPQEATRKNRVALRGTGAGTREKPNGQLDAAWLTDLLHCSVFKAAAATAAREEREASCVYRYF